MPNLKQKDSQIAKLIDLETKRQRESLQMIASENHCSPAVREALGSILTDKYAEGYPGKRYYGGNQFIDKVEQLCIDRAKKTFQGGVCKCTTTFGFAGKRGGVCGYLLAWRKCNGIGFAYGRAFDTRN